MNTENIKLKLSQFKNSDKFKVYQNLQPAVENSTSETIYLVNGIFNKITDELIHSLDRGGFNKLALKNILLRVPNIIEDKQLDTEDFEFCYELIIILSKIVGVDIEDDLD